MRIDILTLFPEMFSALNSSILKNAQESNLIKINYVDIRNFSTNKHKKVDDYTYGGGAGMVMAAQPIYDAIKSVQTKDSYTIYMSPSGNVLKQKKVLSIAQNIKHLIILCGHYEGVDQRVIDLCVDEEISIGDYVLTGGEIPAMVLVDSISRHIKGVLGSSESIEDESFSNGLLEYPHYTRPEVFKSMRVPDVLLSGHHEKINKWRKEKSIEKTKKNRPDLLGEKYED